MARPLHPSLIPKIPMTYRAEIREHDGWWFHYVVHRAVGICIPENSTSLHRTLARAQRAAKRWASKTPPPTEAIERYGENPTARAAD